MTLKEAWDSVKVGEKIINKYKHTTLEKTDNIYFRDVTLFDALSEEWEIYKEPKIVWVVVYMNKNANNYIYSTIWYSRELMENYKINHPYIEEVFREKLIINN